MGLSFSFGHLYEESIDGTDKKLVEYCEPVDFDNKFFMNLVA